MAEQQQKKESVEEIKQQLEEVKLDEQSSKKDPIIVDYCSNCGLPPEYCEYGPKFETCKPILMLNHPEIYALISQGVTEQKKEENNNQQQQTTTGTTDNQAKGEQEQQQQQQPKQKKAAKDVNVVTIQRFNRQKRKFITQIIGLDKYGINMKECAKKFGKKFACGSSYSQEENLIEIQGDILYELQEYVLQEYTMIDEKNIVVKEESQKKKK